jgi:DNA-binding transcriptional regulator of glucitol operon
MGSMQFGTALPLGTILLIGFVLAIIVFCVYTAIVFWHWKEYSTGKFTTVANMGMYLLVGFGLLCVMGISTFWYLLL